MSVDGVGVGEFLEVDDASGLDAHLLDVFLLDDDVAALFELVAFDDVGVRNLALAVRAPALLLDARLTLGMELVEAERRARVGRRKHLDRDVDEADLQVTFPRRSRGHRLSNLRAWPPKRKAPSGALEREWPSWGAEVRRARRGRMKRLLSSRPVVVLACALLWLAGARAADRSPAAMASAAEAFLAGLTPEQRQQATLPFEGDERLHWHFIPTEMFPRNGLPIGDDRTAAQLARKLLEVRAEPARIPDGDGDHGSRNHPRRARGTRRASELGRAT